jgi:recombination protein RecR
MAQFSNYLDALVRELTRLPGMGTKSASRIAFHLITMDESDVRRLAASIVELKEKIKTCEICVEYLTRPDVPSVKIPRGTRELSCVVQSQKDALTIEKTAAFRGKYQYSAE